MRQEPQRAVDMAEELMAIARRERFSLYLGFGPVVLGWALGMSGQEDRGAALMLEGLEALPAGLPFRALYAAMQAEVYRKGRRIREALAALDGAVAVVRGSDAHLWEPELYRLRGEIGLLAGEAEVDAEHWLQQSLQTARRQQARFLELRAALALYRLKGRGDDAGEARERLTSIQKGFSEGFATADMMEARRVMDASQHQGITPTVGSP